jgi:hypothetical protein
MDAENRHDIDGIMETFSSNTEMLFNRIPLRDEQSIRLVHVSAGMSESPGAVEELRFVADREHFTEDEIVIEGRLCGKHVKEFQGFAPSGRYVELPYVTFYRFDDMGKLTSERVVMNLGSLVG